MRTERGGRRSEPALVTWKWRAGVTRLRTRQQANHRSAPPGALLGHRGVTVVPTTSLHGWKCHHPHCSLPLCSNSALSPEKSGHHKNTIPIRSEGRKRFDPSHPARSRYHRCRFTLRYLPRRSTCPTAKQAARQTSQLATPRLSPTGLRPWPPVTRPHVRAPKETSAGMCASSPSRPRVLL